MPTPPFAHGLRTCPNRKLAMHTNQIPTAEELNAMTPHEHRLYELKVRRMARRQYLTLIKSRRRDTACAYALIDPYLNMLVAGDHNTGYGLGLDEIHAALLDAEALGVKVAGHPHFPFGYVPLSEQRAVEDSCPSAPAGLTRHMADRVGLGTGPGARTARIAGVAQS